MPLASPALCTFNLDLSLLSQAADCRRVSPGLNTAAGSTDHVAFCLAGEQAIGARPYRVVFAAISLPLAMLAVVYFINHRYDGLALWNVRGVPGVHDFIWILNFVSFFFLYPSTFNLLEVRASATHACIVCARWLWCCLSVASDIQGV